MVVTITTMTEITIANESGSTFVDDSTTTTRSVVGTVIGSVVLLCLIIAFSIIGLKRRTPVLLVWKHRYRLLQVSGCSFLLGRRIDGNYGAVPRRAANDVYMWEMSASKQTY
jgi:hypothetical protein